MVKTSPSNTGGVGSISGRGAKIPQASWPNNQNIKQNKSNAVKNSIKTLKLAHITKVLEKKNKEDSLNSPTK